MADPQRSATTDTDKGAGDHISELWDLIRAYAQQQTVDPLKTLGRFVGFGLAGAVTGAIFLTLLVLGVLRLLQTDVGSWTSGSLNWIPYVIVLVICAVFMGVAFLAMKGKPDEGGR